MEFENAFSRPGKVMDFRENSRGQGKVMEFHFFGPKISCCLKTGKILLVTEKNMPPKGWVFSISESWKILIGHEKVMEFYCPISV